MIRTVWTPALDEFRAFARLSGDDNPIHTDPAYAVTHPFGRPVSHGMLIKARLWALARQAGAEPGQMAAVMFPNPAYADEPLSLTVEIQGTTITGTACRMDGTLVCCARWEPGP